MHEEIASKDEQNVERVGLLGQLPETFDEGTCCVGNPGGSAHAVDGDMGPCNAELDAGRVGKERSVWGEHLDPVDVGEGKGDGGEVLVEEAGWMRGTTEAERRVSVARGRTQGGCQMVNKTSRRILRRRSEDERQELDGGGVGMRTGQLPVGMGDGDGGMSPTEESIGRRNSRSGEKGRVFDSVEDMPVGKSSSDTGKNNGLDRGIG